MDSAVQQRLDTLVQSIPYAQLRAATEALTERYRSPRAGALAPLGADERLAYLATRLPATHTAISEALFRLRAHWQGSPTTLLDLGAGPGTASLAAVQIFAGIRHTHLLERDSGFLEMALALLQGSTETLTTTAASLTDQAPLPEADLVVMAYALNEIPPQDRRAVIDRAWAAARGALLLVEAGTPAGFACVGQAREWLRGHGDGQIAAPCPGGVACPFLTGTEGWCHFPVRVARTRLHRQLKGGSLGWEDEKFCYLAVVRNGATPAAGRLVGSLAVSKAAVRWHRCAKGRWQEETVSVRDKARYNAAKKKSWGDATEETPPQ